MGSITARRARGSDVAADQHDKHTSSMAYAGGTLQEQLTAVETAIQGVLTGAQQYSLGGRALTRANLAELRKERSRLEAKIRRAGGTPQNTLADFQDRENSIRRSLL